jgi:hypothetical protein
MIKIDKTTNYEHKSEHGSSSELAPVSWLDALIKRWDRTQESNALQDNRDAAIKARLLSELLKELRAEKEMGAPFTGPRFGCVHHETAP